MTDYNSEKQMALEQWRRVKRVITGEVKVEPGDGLLQRIKSNFIKSSTVNGCRVDWKHECLLCEYCEHCSECPLQKCDLEGTAYHIIHNYLLFEGEDSVNEATALAACDLIIAAIDSTVPDDFSSDYKEELMEGE